VQWANLGQAAEKLLADFIAELDGLGASIPAECYVASGLIPWDGESLTVSLVSIGQGQPGAPFGGTYVGATATNLTVGISVQILREVPIPQDAPSGHVVLPPLSALNAAGMQGFDDAAALATAAINIHAQYLDTDPGEGFSISDLIPLGPEGGLAGVKLSIHLSLS
jgi:hypothetical protein